MVLRLNRALGAADDPLHQSLLQCKVLRRHERCVPAAPLHQLLVVALLHHPPGIQHNNLRRQEVHQQCKRWQPSAPACLPAMLSSAQPSVPVPTHLVCILHRGQPVGNHHDSAPLHQLLYGRLHQPFILGIQ